MLVQPAFTSYQLRLGEITSYPPGYKENASVFCHTNAWILIAAAINGDADGAFDYYKRTNPSARSAISAVHRCEPYCYAQTIAGRDAPTHGEAKNSWLTGTASWHLVGITQWILGIRPELEGLRIDRSCRGIGKASPRRAAGGRDVRDQRQEEQGHYRSRQEPDRRRQSRRGKPDRASAVGAIVKVEASVDSSLPDAPEPEAAPAPVA